jgi:hypothetical protein
MLREIPSLPALTVVAPGERFNAFAIFLTPAFAFAIDLNVRRSSFVHERRITFFVLAILAPMWERPYSISIRFNNYLTCDVRYSS